MILQVIISPVGLDIILYKFTIYVPGEPYSKPFVTNHPVLLFIDKSYYTRFEILKSCRKQTIQ